MPNWLPAKVVERVVWTEGLFTIHVDCPGLPEFVPGQFLQLAVKDNDDVRVNRPYSVASPHADVIEFFVVLVEEGELTPQLWDLRVGCDLEVSDKAAGSFTLQKTPDAENLWLVGTGTGLAPYIAMLRDGEVWKRFPKVVLIHGVRFAADLAYTQELQDLVKEKGGQFEFVQTLTREESKGCLRGRIPGLVQSGELEKAAGCELSAESSSIMLCGNPAMLGSMEDVLAERQMKRHKRKDPGQIVVERYW